MTSIFTNGFARLLSKMGRAGRLVGMGDNKVARTISYTVQYAPGKQFSTIIKQYDHFTKKSLDSRGEK